MKEVLRDLVNHPMFPVMVILGFFFTAVVVTKPKPEQQVEQKGCEKCKCSQSP